jgi:hypothetical protein
VACFLFTGISFLWYNLGGCAAVVAFSFVLQLRLKRHQALSPAP